MIVFQAFCTKFEEAASQFTTVLERQFTQQFANSFLDSWNRKLSSAGSAPTSTYSRIAASPPAPAAHNHFTHQRQQQQTAPHHQGQSATTAPPREDLHVFIRLEAGAPARTQNSYAIRTHIREKFGAVSDKIRQVFRVKSGWAVQTTDLETRDLLIEKQAEWAETLRLPL